MYKALAIKELRETAWLAALALAAYALILLKLTGYDLWRMQWEPVSSVPFEDGKITFWSSVVAALFGMLLGLRQSWWESLRGTSVFLLHRPISRRALIATKLITGILLFLIATALPLVIYSLWAARPGTHASPFFWSMTRTCWWFWFAFSMVYAAAFLTGLRDARWFGSRLFPLVGVPVSFLLIAELSGAVALLATLAVDAILVTSIFWVAADRDYP